MDVIKGNSEWNCNEDESAEHLLSPGICDAYRDPELLPRIGDEYQVQIPAHMTECAYGLLVESPAYAIISSATYHDILVGLPVSLMWISEEVENSKHEPQDYPRGLTNNSTINKSAKPESIRETNIVPEIDLKAEVELMDVTANDDIEVGESAKLCFPPEISNEMLCDLGGKDYCLVPGSVGNPWSDAEEDSFLLGLYIFGKNLVQVKNFVESKKMGDILSLYYGKFYRSDRYHKWSECRKVRSRKCVYGQRIFTGSRHHEMLSRLLPQLSEERRSILLEAAKAFGEGKTLLEEYVFTLKVMVGLHALVEAVGIGKGKQDLTGMTTEPLKSIQVAPVRPEIPIGKACSTLTPVEIINYLTGGYRLSKARSNDLFWEAVWPLLLARGWHSEQPDDHGFAAASRHSLVFLIPGIEKFSRRKLVKGDHYFDSVSDVLNKVASDPTLLDLDIGEDKGDGSKEETAWSNKTNLNQGNFPSQQRHCYLKPRTPSRTSNAMMFTVVDTSLANGEIKKVRELRSLPVGLSMCTSRSDSEDSDDDSLKESAEESDSSENLCPDMNGTTTKKFTKNDMGKGVFSDREDVEDNASKQSFHINSLGFAKVHEKIPKDQKADRCNGTQTRKRIKHQATRRDILCDRKVLGPVTKRQRLISYDHTKTSCGTIDRHGSKLDKPGCAGEGDIRDDFLSRVDPLVERLSATCSRGSPDISNECTLSSNSDDDDHPHEKHQTRALIDLNIPIPQDAETEPLMMEVTEVKDDPASRQTKDFGMLKVSTSAGDSTPQQSPNMNSRRHSTRNRPLTTKALEALACGFLSIKQKRKSRDVFSLDNQMSRPSRCARSKMRITENFQAEMTDFEGDERRNGGCKSNGDMVSEVQI